MASRFLLLLVFALLPVSVAHAQKAPAGKAEVCSDGRSKGPDTAGHCCWPNQVWSSVRGQCVGIPACPSGTTTEGENCVLQCPAGQVSNADTAGRCCWPSQVWSAGRNTCVGIPTCPEGQRAEGESCVVACSVPGQVVTPDTAGRCCWPNQVWSNSRQTCMGIPSCPQGMEQQGPECIASAPAPAPPPPEPVAQQPAPAPVPGPAPVPDNGAPQPMEGAPVPMDAAPVPMDSTATVTRSSSGAPELITRSEAERAEESLKRSLWVLGVDFLIDMSTGRFGLRLRVDIPLYHGHWVPQLGFGAGVLPPSFIAGTNNTAWAIPLEATLGMRIPILPSDPRIHLVPRAGVVGAILAARRVDFALKVDLGLGVRLNFGSAFGINLGFDALIPAVGPGFVWLTTVGFST
jgi:hypothetical protein